MLNYLSLWGRFSLKPRQSPRKLEFFPRNLVLGEGKGWVPRASGGSLVSQEELSHSSDDLPEHLAGETAPEELMGQ